VKKALKLIGTDSNFGKDNNMETLEFYVIRRKDGKYLRARRQWGEGLKKANVYTKKGSACAQITAWANETWEFGIPDLVPLIATLGEPIDQTERVAKSLRAKKLNIAKRELLKAQGNYKRAKAELDRVRNSFNAELGVAKAESEIMAWRDIIKELTTK
jgi:hypothetical protein